MKEEDTHTCTHTHAHTHSWSLCHLVAKDMLLIQLFILAFWFLDFWDIFTRHNDSQLLSFLRKEDRLRCLGIDLDVILLGWISNSWAWKHCQWEMFLWVWLLDFTYKWCHVVFVWLISLSMMPSRSICVGLSLGSGKLGGRQKNWGPCLFQAYSVLHGNGLFCILFPLGAILGLCSHIHPSPCLSLAPGGSCGVSILKTWSFVPSQIGTLAQSDIACSFMSGHWLWDPQFCVSTSRSGVRKPEF